jgi:6-pyruvoyltetrahydropterin/6-carboxytetrahydropterin synthase
VIRVTRRYRFAASHRLHIPHLTQAENQEIYGKCNNPYGHGHNYELEISVRGPVGARSGRAVDIALLDRLVHSRVLSVLDHKNLNEEVEVFRRVVPTTENLAREVYRRLREHWGSIFSGVWPVLERVRIAETGRNIFEISES